MAPSSGYKVLPLLWPYGSHVPCDGASGFLTVISEASRVNGRPRLKLVRLFQVSVRSMYALRVVTD